jgi:hypothetical protein
MRMPQIKWSDVDLKVIVSLCNLAAIIFIGGGIWASTTGAIATNTKDIAKREAEIVELRKQVDNLRSQDTSIAVIKADVSSMKDNITDLKNAMQRIEARVIDRMQQPIPR